MPVVANRKPAPLPYGSSRSAGKAKSALSETWARVLPKQEYCPTWICFLKMLSWLHNRCLQQHDRSGADSRTIVRAFPRFSGCILPTILSDPCLLERSSYLTPIPPKKPLPSKNYFSGTAGFIIGDKCLNTTPILRKENLLRGFLNK